MYFSSFLLSIASLFIRVGSFQGRWNGFQIGGAMEHWNVLSATMVSRQEEILNSRHSRMAKTVIFWPWWQSFNCFCIETFFFSFVSLFYFWYAKVCAGGAWAPAPVLQCRQPCSLDIIYRRGPFSFSHVFFFI